MKLQFLVLVVSQLAKRRTIRPAKILLIVVVVVGWEEPSIFLASVTAAPSVVALRVLIVL